MEKIRARAAKNATACFALCSLLILLPQPSLRAQGIQPTEYQVKAAYLYNFGKFVKWPEKEYAKEQFTICVSAEVEFFQTLESIVRGQLMDTTPVKVKRVSSPAEVQGCRILYAGRYGDMGPETAAAAGKRFSVLTVSDMPRFIQKRGMIQFVMEDGRVRFMVNLAAAEEAGIVLSSDLLKVAKTVTQTRAKG